MSTPEKTRTHLIAAADQLLDAAIARDSLGSLMALSELSEALGELLGEAESTRLVEKAARVLRASVEPATKPWFDGMIAMTRDYLGLDPRKP
jgi:hypothetical protein